MATRRSTVLPPGLAVLMLACLGSTRGAAQERLFRSDSVLAVTLRADFRTINRDRDTTKVVWREATLSYAGTGGDTVRVPLRVRTRGIWRLANCDAPPIRLRFTDSATKGTLFHGLHRVKLVVPCRGPAEYDQLILQEYAVYRVFQLLTPASLATRLLRITFEDPRSRGRPAPRWAFVAEEPDRLAERLGGWVVTGGKPRVSNLSVYQAALLGVFQYFVGNTDWSMSARHNIAIVTVADSDYAVPFDFDFTGVVGAPYAVPLTILPIKTVRERMWRGRCQSAAELEPILARFEALRDTITALYRGIPGLEPRSVERAKRYYDEFYRTIADRAGFAQGVVKRDCRT